jgi:hypothetical protein
MNHPSGIRQGSRVCTTSSTQSWGNEGMQRGCRVYPRRRYATNGLRWIRLQEWRVPCGTKYKQWAFVRLRKQCQEILNKLV